MSVPGKLAVIDVVATALWAMLPAYIPNNVAVLAGGGRPVDAGRTWRGRRLLGDGKTWRGTAVGTLAGVALAVGLDVGRPALSSAIGVALVGFPAVVAVTLPVGAMLGDLAASFLKRRTGRERGATLPVLDQLDFAVGALVLTYIAADGWFVGTFLDPPTVLLAVLVLTPVLHVGTNVVAYLLGLKNEPY